MFYNNGFGGGMDMFSIFFFIIFAIIIGTFIVNIIKGISEWSYNNKQPILDIECRVASKRIDVSHNFGHTDSNGHNHSGNSYTTY